MKKVALKSNIVYFHQKKDCVKCFSQNNLINDSDNEEEYFIRVVDELIKFDRIKTFISTKIIFIISRDWLSLMTMR